MHRPPHVVMKKHSQVCLGLGGWEGKQHSKDHSTAQTSKSSFLTPIKSWISGVLGCIKTCLHVILSANMRLMQL